MGETRKGTEYVCEVCGTTLLVTEEGVGILEDVVCCERPMVPRKARAKKKAKAMKRAKKKAAKKRKK